MCDVFHWADISETPVVAPWEAATVTATAKPADTAAAPAPAPSGAGKSTEGRRLLATVAASDTGSSGCVIYIF